jgi:hypothetical protein
MYCKGGLQIRPPTMKIATKNTKDHEEKLTFLEREGYTPEGPGCVEVIQRNQNCIDINPLLYYSVNEKGGTLMERSMKTIRLPVELLEQMRPLIAKKNITFTNFVIEAIMNYMRVLNYQEGIDASFGAWKDNQHPELKDGKGFSIGTL